MDRHKDAALLLLSARRDPTQRLRSLPGAIRPKDAEQAYLVQREIMVELGEIGGWKVGSPSPDGPCNCSPMPQAGMQASPGRVSDRLCPVPVVEAEIAVRLGHDLPPRPTPYSPDEVLAAVASCHPAIEVLQSRFTDPDAVDAWSNLADSLAHFGFVHGSAVEGWRGIDLAAERVRLIVNGAEVKARVANPAGDMTRLLVWLANEGARWAGGLRAGQIVTTGSWTGKDAVPPGASVRVAFDHAGDVTLEIAPTLEITV